MKILIVAATHFEVLPIVEKLKTQFKEESNFYFKKEQDEVRILVTGVGIMHTAFAMGNLLAVYRTDFAINAGIAGAFNRTLDIGDVLHVSSELHGDFGVEEQDGVFTDVFEMGLLDNNTFPYINAKLYNSGISGFDFLQEVRGLTVNKVHGFQENIDKVMEKYQPDVESMEGAAFFYSCLQLSIPFVEIRAISNYVEPRNKANWNIPLAIDNLNKTVFEIIETLTEQKND